MLNLILDLIIPEDQSLGMPSAKHINFQIYVEKYQLEGETLQITELVRLESEVGFGCNLNMLNSEQKIEVINRVKSKHSRLFTNFVLHCLKAYYSNNLVLTKLGTGSIPPFPMGNPMEIDDWSILEPVFNSVFSYRKT
jgi:hypothetical protein